MSKDRLHYMDNLRAVVMIVGVFFHTGLAYSPMMHKVWMSASVEQHAVVDVINNFFHIFRMPLFFLVAGFFAALLLEKRGLKQFARNRALRVGLPFIVFWPLVITAILLPIAWLIEQGGTLPPLLQYFADTSNNPEAAQQPLTTTYLWFLYYLVLFYGVACIANKLPLAALAKRIANLSPWLVVAVLPIALLPGLAATIVPIYPPESFVPELWPFLFYGLFFAYGCVLFNSQGIVARFTPLMPWLLIGSLLVYIPVAIYAPREVNFDTTHQAWPIRFTLMVCIAYIAVAMSAVGLVVAKQWLDIRVGFMRYMADASYWIYLMHLPIVLMIQYALFSVSWGLVAEYLITSLGTLFICTITYAFFVRSTWIGLMLNGKRQARFSN